MISAIPGEPVSWPAPARPRPGSIRHAAELAVHRDAGTALRLLHDAQPPLPCTDLGSAKTAELDQLAPQAAGLLTRRELTFARSEAAALTATGGACLVPCHGDYTPRNWLADGDTVRIIDFEWARLDAPLADLARLHLGIWHARPDLRAAFLDGYGQLDDADSGVLRGCSAVMAVWLVVKAHETGQPSFEKASRAALNRQSLLPEPGVHSRPDHDRQRRSGRPARLPSRPARHSPPTRRSGPRPRARGPWGGCAHPWSYPGGDAPIHHSSAGPRVPGPGFLGGRCAHPWPFLGVDAPIHPWADAMAAPPPGLASARLISAS